HRRAGAVIGPWRRADRRLDHVRHARCGHPGEGSASHPPPAPRRIPHLLQPAHGRTMTTSSPRTVFDRDASLARLGQESFDLLVIGGGITGTGVALDAASRGLRTALVERGDF